MVKRIADQSLKRPKDQKIEKSTLLMQKATSRRILSTDLEEDKDDTSDSRVSSPISSGNYSEIATTDPSDIDEATSA